ncbi:MFS transporter [Streptomyces sp. PRKS01-29]|nr:MFS transporter [Streptomyces sabulosicollis]MBI0296012.1 MFS transporter [Streptomyces sabulosicollis]
MPVSVNRPSLEAGRGLSDTPPRASTGFIASYIAAQLGLYVVLLTPGMATIAVRLQQIDPLGKTENLSLVMGVGAFVAMVANPLFGRLSDRTTSRFGRRRPWLVGGAAVGLLCMVVMGTTDSVPVLAGAWWAAQAALNATLAALSALLPERIPHEQQGRVSGFHSFAMYGAIMIGVGLASVIGQQPTWMFVIPGIVGLVAMGWFGLRLNDARLAKADRPPLSVRSLLSAFYINPRTAPDYSWAWLSRFLCFLGFFCLSTYQAFYLTDHLNMPPAKLSTFVLGSTVVQAICVMVSATLFGWLSDRAGRRKPFVFLGVALFAVSMVVVISATGYPTFLVGVGFASLGIGVYSSVDTAIAVAVLRSPRTAARDMGVLNIANTLPHSLITVIAPPILAIGSSTPSNYTALFIAATLFTLVGALTILRVKEVN